MLKENNNHSPLLMLILFVAGCSTPSLNSYTTYTPIMAEESDAARIISIDNKNHAELTNGRLKMLVDGSSSYIHLRLIVPRGEELYVQEPFVELTEAVSHEQLDKQQIVWEVDKSAYISMNQLGVTELDKYIDQIMSSKFETESNKLVGLEMFPFSTVYLASIFIEENIHVQFKARIPAFRTSSNETVKFVDVSFVRETKSSWYWKKMSSDDVDEFAANLFRCILFGDCN